MSERTTRALPLMVALALLLAPVSALAQGTTGTVRGKVTDQATGEPLAAVNVVLLETDGTFTQMGAFTNADGDFVIINVPPTRYNIRATMMGYRTFEVEQLLVTVGVSTVQNFQLEATVLDIGEVVRVVAERDIIQRDVTATQQSYTFDEMERMAVSSTTEILSLQTNVYSQYRQGDGEIYQYYARGQEQMYMRGGRNAEVAFMIDGMQVTNLLYGGQAARVSPFSLSEMVVMAGGMSAEFGNAMSGVVNMVTREGGSDYDANVEILSSEISPAPQDDVRDMTSLQGYLGGPVPVTPNLFFFSSGMASMERSGTTKKDDIVYDLYADPTDPDWLPNPDIDYDPDDVYDQRTAFAPNRRIHPLDIYSGWLGYGFDDQWNGMLNLTYKFSPSMKLNLSSQLNGRWTMPYRWNSRFSTFFGIPSYIQDNAVWGTPRYDTPTDPVTGEPIIDGEEDVIAGTGRSAFFNEKEILFENNRRLAFVWTQQLNSTTFYSVRGSYYNYYRTNRSKRWVNDVADWPYARDGWAPTFDYRYIDVDPTSGRYVWQPEDPMVQVTLVPTPYNSGDPDLRRYGWVSDRGSAGLGVDGSGLWWQKQDDITRTLKADLTSQISTHHQVKAGVLYNALTITNRTIEAPWLTNPFQNANYRKSPWELGLYLQDKVEYDFLILNAGFRYDAARAGDQPWWIDPRDPINYGDPDDPDDDELVIYPALTDPPSGAAPPVDVAKLRSQISPRFGISHPVTDQAVVYFNYGHFYQNPQYDNQFFPDNLLGTGPPLIGNPNLESEKTVQYEFGLKQQFSEIYALELTMWSKDTSNLVSSETMPPFYNGIPNPYLYVVFVNYDYASSKGFDLNLIRRYANYFQGRVNYSYMTSSSNREEPWSGFWGRDELDDAPKRPAKLGWDQPHKVSLQSSVTLPEGAGPEWFGIRPFENMSASIIYRAAAGRPYTPTTKERSLERNSGSRPWTFQWDLRVYRDFETMGIRYSLFADVRNLFDRVNVMQVYSRTGKADDPGPGATSYTDTYDVWHYYGTPRTINVGLRIFF
jgi:outer membrane receptor protein involved in Fe transport